MSDGHITVEKTIELADCPACGAKRGKPCLDVVGAVRPRLHKGRLQRARVEDAKKQARK